MKKYFIQLYSNDIGYGPIRNFHTKNFELQYLWFFLYRPQYTWIHTSQSNTQHIFWSSDSIKQKADIHFNTPEEKNSFNKAYNQYTDQRWDDMPILTMTLQNYETIVHKWQEVVLKQQPKYIILSQDDAGYVDFVGKDELSEQDLTDMKLEHEKYLKYQTAYDQYIQSRPDIVDELWHGPESSEYEADWQKFLDKQGID